jgi:hypothetical protein
VKKLTLDPEALRVESFEPREREEKEGTVLAHDGSYIGESCATQCVTYECECMLTVPVDDCG